jgi:hypothetical protein
MSPKQRTLAEEMALAVLRGDTVAAYALADQLLEERDGKVTKMAKAAEALRRKAIADDGYAVYRWPEFKAFCDRAGILWDLRTISMTFSIVEGGRLEIDQKYIGSDNDTPLEPSNV